MSKEEEEEEVLFDSFSGKRIVSAHHGDGGFHIDLDDNRTIIVIGYVGVWDKETATLQ